ncbi:MAG: nitrilase family protein [Bacteroidales bacterium]|nr:nitrilase family protein [Bacteroidales bacterium]
MSGNNKNLHFTYIQADLQWQDKQANLEHFGQLLKDVPFETDLVLLPETFNTAFPVDPKEFAETEDGTTMQWLKQKAQELNAVICSTFLLEIEGHYHNSLVWMRPDGSYELYHKRHTFSMGGENQLVERGSDSLIVELNGWRIKPMVCYDIRFPVWSKNHYENGQYAYDLGIYLANFPDSRMNVWDTLLQARAIENQAYFIGVNRVGDDPEEVHYSGHSRVISPKGKVISMADIDTEAIVSCVLDYEKLQSFRDKFPVGKDWDSFQLLTPNF